MTLRGIARRACFLIAYHGYARIRLARTDSTRLLGYSLVIPSGVFHPALYFSSKTLGEYLAGLPLEGCELLDMGCGSGILSLVAAGRGANVTAVDVNPRAVEATRENALRNNLRVRVLEGNLFDPLALEPHFDYIVFNPPYYGGTPADMADRAWQGGADHGVIRDFVPLAASFLNPNGAIFLILSSDLDLARIADIFRSAGFSFECVSSKELIFEHFFVYRASRTS